MRLLILPVLGLLAAGCAGHVADYVGPREGIVEPQLARYGLSGPQSRCIAGRLVEGLTPRQLRLFERALGSVRQGYFDPAQLTVRDMLHVASSMGDDAVGLAAVRAAASCDATPELIARRDPPVPVQVPAVARLPAWLNLGAAPTGQSIAIDASSLEQQGTVRVAWFRLTNPGGQSTGLNYRLRVDCTGRTIQPLAERRAGAGGAPAEMREYPAGEEAPMPVEGGTVMEIAFLSLCT